ncbi:hypothetical protein F4861DRAFT_167145 [Xylaria intraflava]|nr:hypothetical protein F4861DRAFT_167145 [Xylaria intraflava]
MYGLALMLLAGHALSNPLERRADIALDPWVSVGDDGKPSTVTPVLTTVSGTPTILSGAPHDITATVFTTTSYGKVITSTGSAPLPTADSHGAGSFAACHNLNNDTAPWCLPTGSEPLYVGTTYYFTWDPQYFKAPNTSVIVAGNYVNMTTGETMTDSYAFQSPLTMAAWGSWALDVTSKLLKFQGSQNITVTLSAIVDGARVNKPGPRITVANRPGPVADSRGKLPQGAALYIALPTVIGFIAICVIGTCLWNRHHRQIRLGRSVMGRNYDVGKMRPPRFGLGRRNKAADANGRIQLMQREIEAEGGEVYRDLPDPADMPRRDSDALGSLVSTPTEDRRMNLGRGPVSDGEGHGLATGNTFRDELRRQANERR